MNKFFLYFIFLAGFFVFVNPLDAGPPFKLCQDLADSCRSTSSVKLAVCTGYIQALADVVLDPECVPEGTTPMRLQEIFLEWTTNNQNQGLLKTEECFKIAVVGNLPCISR